MSAEWRPDPSGVYEHRWWDGDRWTEHVALGGAQLADEVNDPSTFAIVPPTASRPHSDESASTAPDELPPPADAAPVLPNAGWLRDPSRMHSHRWWDGGAWTDWVADGGEPVSDPSLDPSGLREPDPVGYVEDHAAVPGSQSTAARPTPSHDPDRTVGDRVVHALGTVTLNNWASRRLADALMIPELTEARRQQPTWPRNG